MKTSVAVVVPARNEARWIADVVRSMPPWVEHIIVVDDASEDDTARHARAAGDVTVVTHARRRGVGGAIVSGYRHALELGADIVAVMAGDGQMDPEDLACVIEPVARGDADYVKGNRLRHPQASAMPPWRAAGTFVLGVLTSVCTGTRIGDSQCGFTAISHRALLAIDLDGLWSGYGYPNDLIAAIARAGLRIREVVVRPVYRGEASGLRAYHVGVIALLLARAAVRRVIASQSVPSHPREARSPKPQRSSSSPARGQPPAAHDAPPPAIV